MLVSSLQGGGGGTWCMLGLLWCHGIDSRILCVCIGALASWAGAAVLLAVRDLKAGIDHHCFRRLVCGCGTGIVVAESHAVCVIAVCVMVGKHKQEGVDTAHANVGLCCYWC